ncbi:unnamed protein product, partial [Mesorhabditis belari]|uniref:Transposase MuDR plant domain-containing protein n=1 Tax=Mesorhabditis belari TaxID=2138241 RepID=A0AAF3J346_9BILA
MIAILQRAKGLFYDDEMFKHRKDKVLKSGKISYKCTKAGCKDRCTWIDYRNDFPLRHQLEESTLKCSAHFVAMKLLEV